MLSFLTPSALSAVLLPLLLPQALGERDSANQQVTPPHTGVSGFVDPLRFSLGATWLGFEDLSTDDQALLNGVELSLADGSSPRRWVDTARRTIRPSTPAALTNAGTPSALPLLDPGRGPRQVGGLRRRQALTIRFPSPVNRAGLEIRRLDGEQLNVILRCCREDKQLGSQFFDASERFSFVGLESTETFDVLLVEFTNPNTALFSIDNLILQLDLTDTDNDGHLNIADLCPGVPGINQVDRDGDGLGDACDPFPLDPQNDIDGDGIGRMHDNCPLVYNPDQLDDDGDGVGNVCDSFFNGQDMDRDGVGDDVDNCPATFNPEQVDCDSDGIGDVCDPSLVNPASVSFDLYPGECVTLTKTLCIPPSPPVVDVAILFDTTGSMGGEIEILGESIISFVNGVRRALPFSDVRFGLVAIKDYPGVHDSCNYSERYSLGRDAPFEVKAPIGVSDAQLLDAITKLEAAGGQDLPEAYGRALWEVLQPDSGIGFRFGAARFVMLVGDAPPHDCQIAAGIGYCLSPSSTGADPGRDGILNTLDDIDFQNDALMGLVGANIPVLMLYSGLANFCAWEAWAAFTGGKAVHADTMGVLPLGTDLVQDLVDLIRFPVVKQVDFMAMNPCGLDISFDPPLVAGPIDVSLGAMISLQETICVPASLAGHGRIDCTVDFFADNVLLASQNVQVNALCATYVLDFETEDDFTTPLLNGQAVGAPEEFGRIVSISSTGSNLGPATFDSTPGGPNDPSINQDMLIGHGNLLLLQDDARPAQSPPGFFSQPTDDPDGGDLIFDFIAPIDPVSVLLADINPPPNLGASVTLTDEGGGTRSYHVPPGWTGPYGDAGPRQLNLSVSTPQPGANGHAAVATESEGFRQERVVRIVVHMTGFGALDELVFCR